MDIIQHAHPAVVHFPIALLSAAFGCKIYTYIKKNQFVSDMALYLLIAGTLGMIAGWLTGDFSAESFKSNPVFSEVIEKHEFAAQISFWLAIAASVLAVAHRMTKNDYPLMPVVSDFLLAVCFVSLINTGYSGGKLVYQYSISVQQLRDVPVTNAPSEITNTKQNQK
ncbi:MAG: hypothetical protein LWX56_00050 [Ignavibacteria bacterium]|nr:hypothetical protein [Ignavibacteria bacterium]